MISILFVTGVSFILALMLTRFVRDASTQLGLVDLPDNHRKTHQVAVPRTGGVAIVAAYLLSYAVLHLHAAFRRRHCARRTAVHLASAARQPGRSF